MKKNSTITVNPNVGRITEGLRDTGYSVDTAIADLIDNSIAAGATFIDVRIALKDDGKPVVAVGDNGHGMDQEALINCMRYGSQAQESISRLGKFGIGLKTASTAFCRRVLVVSRPSSKAKALQAAWDLDHLAACGEWELELGKPDKEAQAYLDLCAHKGPGTVVIWEKIDRLLTAEIAPAEEGLRADPQAGPQERLTRLVKNLAEHLALVFQRYLDPAFEQTRTVRLHLNGEAIQPWNPFCPDVANNAGTHILTVPYGDETVPIVITAHLLPRAENFADENRREAANLVANRQGIYVYRENRLIHGPDWLGIHAQDPAWTLLRVSLSFDARMDSVFMVDIKKSRVLINEHLYAWLKNSFLPSILQRAEERWRQGVAETSRKTAQMRHAVSDNTISQHLEAVRKADVLEIFPNKHEAMVRNNNGTVMAAVAVLENLEAPLRHIHTSALGQDDLLWEPSLVNKAPAVTLNTGHPFYSKIYMPNEQNTVLVQALDMLFWSLAQAEINNVTAESRDYFAAMRQELARNVAKLTDHLPD